MKKIILLISLLVISCSGIRIHKYPNVTDIPREYAPMNDYKNNYGVVSYLNEGVSSIRKARREESFKKMYELCNGKYVIIEEKNSETDPLYIVNENMIGSVSSTYVFFKFECVE